MSIEQSPEESAIRLDAVTQRRIETYAHAVGLPPSEVIRKAFEEFDAAHDGPSPQRSGEETAFDALSRAGLIGCLKATPGTPTDLVTNPGHMEGFGRE